VRIWVFSLAAMKRLVGAAIVLLAMVSPIAAGVPSGPDPEDRRCLACHGQEKIASLGPVDRRAMVGTLLDTTEAGRASAGYVAIPLTGRELPTRPGLFVRSGVFENGVHATVRCVQCHEDAKSLPHRAELNTQTCATSCHEGAAKEYASGAHLRARDLGVELAPTCASCHGGHDILKASDRKAPQHKLNSLKLCGDCHAKHEPSANETDPARRVSDYLASTHARAVLKSGLPMAATCAECHGAHGVKPSTDPTSTVHRDNVPTTCGKCHVGVVEQYATSIHAAKNREKPGSAAVCTDCHTSHQITLASTPEFLRDVVADCGKCHDDPDASGGRVWTSYSTYASSYHGQVTKLGGSRAAKCSDCHGAHDIRSLNDPQSRVAKANLITTCGGCHSGANANFVKFDPHASHRDSKNHPVLHGVWLYFMVMMSAVFTFFGVHTMLWFMRSRIERRKTAAAGHAHPKAETAIRRFSALDRVNHLFVALTFFGLTATGIPLVFASDAWARRLAAVVGGIEAAGMWHRFFAIVLILNFALHFGGLARAFLRRTCSAREWLFGPASLIPRWKDAKDIFGMHRWFVGLGRPPRLDRWTYWEKFDYWAEVGGSMIIGGSGLLLWFPEFASRLVPGWFFNIAMIVHGYEALLAICFIFTIHFFNAHLRPGMFPVDEVIFTGSVPEHELREQRPEEYERLVKSGKLESLRVKSPNPARRPLIVVIAAVTVGFGLVLLVLILIGGLT
jgi:cytochrome b subunit of formate dehydrogenase